MKERPILFSAPMVNAILAGNKTQTRRAIKPRHIPSVSDEGRERGLIEHPDLATAFCPYGRVGTKLWVRETWAEVGATDPGLIVYRADYPACVPSEYENVPPAEAITWKPSIHMFRRYSRILLELTGVRVERLNDISEADAVAEGAPCYVCGGAMDGLSEEDCHCFHRKATAVDYRNLWESINGVGSWDANPWVWCLEFRRIEKEVR